MDELKKIHAALLGFDDGFFLIGSLTAKEIRDAVLQAIERIENLETQLWVIQDFAHDRSRGPVVEDDLWEVRRMAQELL